jgi:hypothetical protein
LKFILAIADHCHVRLRERIVILTLVTLIIRHAPRKETNSMEKLEAYRQAVAELGSVSAEEMSEYLDEKYGIEIAPNFIPLYRAALEEWLKVKEQRQVATTTVALAAAG